MHTHSCPTHCSYDLVRREDSSNFVDAIAVRIAQQGQSIAALRSAGALLLQIAGDEVRRAHRWSLSASLAFGDKNVTVRKNKGLPRGHKIACDWRDCIALRNHRATITPSSRVGDGHAGEETSLLFRQGDRKSTRLNSSH